MYKVQAPLKTWDELSYFGIVISLCSTKVTRHVTLVTILVIGSFLVLKTVINNVLNRTLKTEQQESYKQLDKDRRVESTLADSGSQIT